jgi:predicted CopG family antitoxin
MSEIEVLLRKMNERRRDMLELITAELLADLLVSEVYKRMDSLKGVQFHSLNDVIRWLRG